MELILSLIYNQRRYVCFGICTPENLFLESTNRCSHKSFVLAVEGCCFVNGTLHCIQDYGSSGCHVADKVGSLCFTRFLMILDHSWFSGLNTVAIIFNRGCGGKYLLPWIYSIMVNHRHYIISQEPKNQQLLTTLHKVKR